MAPPPKVWVLTDDRPGTANQVLGVAEALGWPFEVRRITYGPLARIPNVLLGARLAGLTEMACRAFQPPWPDLVIAAGRRIAPAVRWLKRRSPSTFTVQLMWPGTGRDLDLVAVPEHDGVAPAPNLVSTVGAPHRVTPATLVAARTRLTPTIAHLPRPYVACLIGGASRHGSFTPADAVAAARAAARLATERQGSVLITTSRRTGIPAEHALEDTDLAAPVWLHAFSRGGANPYLGLLGHADAIVVTADSASMCTEGCATGRPVFLFQVRDWRPGKLDRLHKRLAELGYLHDPAAGWPTRLPPPLLPQDELARVIRQRLSTRPRKVASPRPAH
jgi:mitochondrial fission protein ELM1